MTTALRELLGGVVDYAGLFPPASVDVPTAVRNYAEYRASDDRWMLGRFVVGVAKIPELRATIAALKKKEAWPISVVVPDALAATAALRGHDDASVRIESVEVKAKSAADIALVGRAAGKVREVYVEVPIDATMDTMLDALATAKLRAKVRTGGVNTEQFPSAADIARFIRGCLDRSLLFKATAGLHHPLRGSYPMTYAPNAPSGPMFGFLNVFLTASFMREGLTDDDARALLEEADPAAFTIEDQAIRWRQYAVTADGVRAARAGFITSFGSCSFREPVGELPFPVSSTG